METKHLQCFPLALYYSQCWSNPGLQVAHAFGIPDRYQPLLWFAYRRGVADSTQFDHAIMLHFAFHQFITK